MKEKILIMRCDGELDAVVKKAERGFKNRSAFLRKAVTQFIKYQNVIEAIEESGLKMNIIKQRIKKQI